MMIKYQMINPLQIQIYPSIDKFCFHLDGLNDDPIDC